MCDCIISWKNEKIYEAHLLFSQVNSISVTKEVNRNFSFPFQISLVEKLLINTFRPLVKNLKFPCRSRNIRHMEAERDKLHPFFIIKLSASLNEILNFCLFLEMHRHVCWKNLSDHGISCFLEVFFAQVFEGIITVQNYSEGASYVEVFQHWLVFEKWRKLLPL